MFEDIVFGKPSQKPKKLVVESEDTFSYDKARASNLVNQMTKTEALLDGIELPEHILSSLSYNVSTVTKDRRVPTTSEKVRAIWDFWTFIDILDFHGGSLAFSECHKELTSWKFRPDANFRQMVLYPRGHLKSSMLCVAYTLWRVYQNPNIRMFVGCESLKLSKAFIREIETYLTDDWLKDNLWNSRPHFSGPLIPEMDSLGKSRRSIVKDISSEFGEELSTEGASTKKKVWRAEAIQVVRPRVLKEPTVTAGSVGQTSTGFHFDDVVFDDVHTFANCKNEALIDKVFSWIYDIESVLDSPYVDFELLNIFHNVLGKDFPKGRRWAISGGRLTVLGTRYDDLDFYGHVLENSSSLNFEVKEANIYKNGIDNSAGYLWPEAWNEALEEQKKAQFQKKFGTSGLARFHSQYLNQIVSFETAILNWDNIQWLHPSDIEFDGDNHTVTIFARNRDIIAEFRPRLVIDPSATSSKTSDFCAIAVGGVSEGKLYVVDFWMQRAKPEEGLEAMYELVNKWNLNDVTVEMVGGFKILEFTIRQMWMTNPKKYRPLYIKSYEPKGVEKNVRVETMLSPLLDNKGLYLPLGLSRNKELRNQFMFFGKATAKDDGVDVLSILKEVAFPKIVKQRPISNKLRLQAKVNTRWGGLEYEVR